MSPADTKQDCQLKASEFETATRSRAEDLATLAKARTVISQKTVGAESFSYSLVPSFFLQVSQSLLSSCLDLAKIEAVRRIRDLAKRESSLSPPKKTQFTDVKDMDRTFQCNIPTKTRASDLPR